MEKGRPLLRWAGILLVFAAVSFVGLEVQGAKNTAPASQAGRPDQITIDTLAAFGKLELPAVTFFHDKHTDALLKEKKGCESCHVTENKKLSLAFMRKKGTPPDALQGIYHAGCIGCHTEMAEAKEKTGPLDGFCRDCHNAKPPAPAILEAGLDKALHNKHVASKSIPGAAGAKDNCAACHHSYDQGAKKTFYAKGKEDSCRYCHQEQSKDGALSLRQASHQQCVVCHYDLTAQGGKEKVPVLCADCHGAAGQLQVAKKASEAAAKAKKVEVPRLQRGQPDATLITYNPKAKDAKAALMTPVAFDHKAHEQYADSCRACHHASMDACSTCHTLKGAKEGGFVSFEQAMHAKSSKHSCVGCHTAKQAEPSCAGCHASMAETGRPAGDSCRQCHLPLPQGVTNAEVAKMTPAQKTGLAESQLKNRVMTSGVYAAEDIPDRVLIKCLSNEFEPADFAHRKVVYSLMKGMKDSKLAGYFHSNPGTVCQGCHHNSPPAKNPPSCASCHVSLVGKASFDPRDANRPGLLAAYHGQCIGCHQDMNVKPAATECNDCHKPKKK